MTAATATVIKMIESLPEPMQERVVERLQDYIEDMREDMEWNQSFARSQDKLVAVAKQAKADAARGLAAPLNPDDL